MTRPAGRRSRAAALAALAVVTLLAAATPATGAIGLDAPREVTAHLPGGVAATASFDVPFHLERDGQFYAKLLVTPWNPVNPGTPNGTIGPDGYGATGWWVVFRLLDIDGDPVALDAAGQPVPLPLGHRVSSTPTPPVPLVAAGYRLGLLVHAPAAAACDGAVYRVPVALAYRDGAFLGDATSGGRLEPSRGFTAILNFTGGDCAIAPGGIAGGSGTGNVEADGDDADGPGSAGPGDTTGNTATTGGVTGQGGVDTAAPPQRDEAAGDPASRSIAPGWWPAALSGTSGALVLASVGILILLVTLLVATVALLVAVIALAQVKRLLVAPAATPPVGHSGAVKPVASNGAGVPSVMAPGNGGDSNGHAGAPVALPTTKR